MLVKPFFPPSTTYITVPSKTTIVNTVEKKIPTLYALLFSALNSPIASLLKRTSRSTRKTRKSRIILTPFHAKRFMKAMIDNVKKFETANGTIQDMESVEIPFNFGGPAAQA